MHKYIVKTIKSWVGIPVSIGLSTTKTLSKIANNLAKKNPKYAGVCVLKGRKEIKEALTKTQIENVWGIGKSLATFLKRYQVFTAEEFSLIDRKWIRKNMGVVGERIYLELNGISCLNLEQLLSQKKAAAFHVLSANLLKKLKKWKSLYLIMDQE